LEEEVFYGIFAYMFKEREIINDALMTWKNMEEINETSCNFQNLIKILNFGSVANWSTHLCTYPSAKM
jgi:hypothetical protein